MDNINVFIVEDTPEESNRLVSFLETNGYYVTGVARSFKEAITVYNKVKVDIVIIDVFLNGVPDGISFAEVLHTNSEEAKPFVFLTNSVNREVFKQAKLTRPYSYLMKPFNELEILYAIEMAVSKFYTPDNDFLKGTNDVIISKEYLFVKKGKSLKKVDIASIIYIEVEEGYCNIITEKEKYVILISLKRILQILDKTFFYRVHRNFIVNIHKVEEVVLSDNLIVLSGNYKAILSNRYKEVVKQVKALK